MRLTATGLPGLVLVEPVRHEDERGWFARTFDAEVFAAHGLRAGVLQMSTSHNRRAGTLRGLHLQRAPHEEAKLVRCTRGAVFDVAVDLRPDAGAYLSWYGAELTPENGLALYVPPGFAHGFQTLVPDTEVHYVMPDPYVPAAASGVRWDDPAFGVRWPAPPPEGRVMSERDASYPDFAP